MRTPRSPSAPAQRSLQTPVEITQADYHRPDASTELPRQMAVLPGQGDRPPSAPKITKTLLKPPQASVQSLKRRSGLSSGNLHTCQSCLQWQTSKWPHSRATGAPRAAPTPHPQGSTPVSSFLPPPTPAHCCHGSLLHPPPTFGFQVMGRFPDLTHRAMLAPFLFS